MGHPETSGSTDGAADLETAAPDTGSPTPSPTPSVTPSPPPDGVAEEAAGHYDNQQLIAMNPAPVVQNEGPDCLPTDHNLSHLLVRVRREDETSKTTKKFSFCCIRNDKFQHSSCCIIYKYLNNK